jgi:hypothetical protein
MPDNPSFYPVPSQGREIPERDYGGEIKKEYFSVLKQNSHGLPGVNTLYRFTQQWGDRQYFYLV